MSYTDRPRTFPDMRSKTYSPLIIRILRNLNVRALSVLLLLIFGGIFYMGARTSPMHHFVCLCSMHHQLHVTKWVLAKDEGPPEMLTSGYVVQVCSCSGIAGYVGMWVSVCANVRVSNAARLSAREALQIAVRAGGFSALVVVGIAVIGIAILYSTFYV